MSALHQSLCVFSLIALLALAVAVPDDPLFVFLLHRHGDRGPIDNNIGTVPPAVFAQQWPLGLGELTAHGMIQLYQLGQQLRSTYTFLPTRFDPTVHYIQSTNVHRTLESAQSLLLGFYGNTGPFDPLTNSSLPHSFQPVPVCCDVSTCRS